jgi:hypothetical protein
VHDTDGQTTDAMNAGLVPLADRAPALVAAAGERASYRFFEFFTAQIRNPNTRFEAYLHEYIDGAPRLLRPSALGAPMSLAWVDRSLVSRNWHCQNPSRAAI